ncbi:MAG: SMP-30/gluconolactonase/LRE family protein [Pseudomonadota bacterium]
MNPVCLWEVGAELGEGPIWHAATRSVYFVDIKGRQIHRCAADGSARRSWDAPQQPGFIVPLAGGGFACGLQDGVYHFDEDNGKFTLMRSVEGDQPSNRFNDGFVDAQGCLWFGSMDDAEYRPTGSLYRLGASGEVQTRDRDYVITNGPAMSPDGKTLYHTDTLKKQVYAFDVLPEATLARKRVFVAMDGPGHPDGMAVDADGFVWIALFGGARIERYSAAGELVGEVRFPCPNITKLAFGGDDLRTVYVTTAWKGMSPDVRAQYPLAGALFTFRSETPGLVQGQFLPGELV